MLFDIIEADPPWMFGSRGPRRGKFGKLDYPCMSVEELCALPVKQLAAPTAALFLWFPGAFIEQVCVVARAWGFVPIRIDKVWEKLWPSGKPHTTPGPWGLTDVEFVLLASRGKMCGQQISPRNQRVLQPAEYTGRHSGKPEIFRRLIENRFVPGKQMLELFGRGKRDGWWTIGKDVTGNDIADDLMRLIAL